MSDIYLEKDKQIFYQEQPNTYGYSNKYLEALNKIETLYKEYYVLCDKIEEQSLDNKYIITTLIKQKHDKYLDCIKAEIAKDTIYDMENQ